MNKKFRKIQSSLKIRSIKMTNREASASAVSRHLVDASTNSGKKVSQLQLQNTFYIWPQRVKIALCVKNLKCKFYTSLTVMSWWIFWFVRLFLSLLSSFLGMFIFSWSSFASILKKDARVVIICSMLSKMVCLLSFCISQNSNKIWNMDEKKLGKHFVWI